ncbi:MULTISPECIES: hypothetical protein [Paenibacillus]|uniref:hypothetical protein n=1 Tax=Paenibacillus TaxID=44249 RepID=UPI0022B8F478|nr:hypothetical protein [Paenibacillus caseinilyticus]MCZ8521734.1 hypothetical protein [Paenibacillus caseinilyticus]
MKIFVTDESHIPQLVNYIEQELEASQKLVHLIGGIQSSIPQDKGKQARIVHGLTGREGLTYLNLKKRDGTILPEPWIGIRPKTTETWRRLGLNYSIVITAVTAMVPSRCSRPETSSGR